MALTGTRLSEPFLWSSELDKAPEKQKSVFTFHLPTAEIRAYIFDNVLAFEQGENGNMIQLQRNNIRNMELLRFCLKGITNFKDPDGKDITYEEADRYLFGKVYKNATDDYLSRIPHTIINESCNALVSQINLSQVVSKK